MVHLLKRDAEDHSSPAGYGFELSRGDTFLLRSLEAGRGVDVEAQEVVLELSGLAQRREELEAGL